MVPSQDHKRVFDRDRGPNTGGMGAYSTDGILSSEEQREVVEAIVGPTIRGMAAEGKRIQRSPVCRPDADAGRHQGSGVQCPVG